MKKRKLKKLLRKTEEVRDEWCKEYGVTRDELLALKSTLRRLSADE